MNPIPSVYNQDAQLVQLVQKSCKQSFNKLYENYWEATYVAACKRCRDHDEAKDVVQDIFTHIWLKRETLIIENLPAYLHVAVRNKISKLEQKQKLKLPLFNILEAMPAKNQRADCSLIYRELNQSYEVFLNTLSCKKQIIFRLRFQEDLSTKDIAVQLGVSRKTIQNQLGKVVDQIRTVFTTT
ncbi:MAG: RNA polymerase sigma factor [Bacteroidia bacterium]